MWIVDFLVNALMVTVSVPISDIRVNIVRIGYLLMEGIRTGRKLFAHGRVVVERTLNSGTAITLNLNLVVKIAAPSVKH